jgi:NTE family protein
MPAVITDLPDTLVLGAGGTLGEAWMRGLLSGVGLDFRGCEYILGTSAGSIVAATLVSGRQLDAGDRAAAGAARVRRARATRPAGAVRRPRRLAAPAAHAGPVG